MSTILVTGSTRGIGYATARDLLDNGHRVIVHARAEDRLPAVTDLVDAGADTVVGDLAHPDEVRDIAGQAGAVDAVIHNAGVLDGPSLLQVNVVAPYMLSCLLPRPRRVVLVSSSMHRGGRPDLAGIDWSGNRTARDYSDSKLYATTVMTALARLWPDTLVNSVCPGWVPTRMGGPAASDDPAQAHTTQTWLASSDDPQALVTGGYWHHRRLERPHPATTDRGFRDTVLASLADATGLTLPVD